MLRHALEAHGHAVLEARDEPEAIRELRQTRPVVVLTDLKLPVGDGFGVLRAAKELDPDLPVVVMTAYGSIQDAVAAMREGAMDFLAKPVEPDHLLLMVERAIAQRRMLTEYIVLKEELAERRGAPRIIGEDGKLRQVSQQLHRAAATDATVLLEGESGTGKEFFASALHALSPRADGPFVAINCAAVPETLLESELFGYEKGAFTDATPRKPGDSSSPNAGRCSSTRSARCRSRSRRRSCASSRRSSSSASAVRNPARRRAHRGGDQPRPQTASERASVPRGSVLPPVGVPDPDSAAARARRGRADPGAISSTSSARS